ncbi:hypothetical protein L227DRAFT_561608 [Lentinus tigrinus ALCF2SS1-6]|uniref:F-box domain-containing protein n=1 Tax=Lentinus tigrinus ALCF2SS1-6 TaxID=1328759 RepID=A0A5C2SI41_9APHY|nr:hypothetical protein L227DRAFT_561608 [Lentinus tigrinus ALCF2SS1-6]
MQNQPRLPIEVCEHIIDSCYVEHAVFESPLYDTLRACALVCSGWVFRARLNLYYHVWLRGPLTPDLLERTLNSIPHLGYLIHVLTVGVPEVKPTAPYISFARGTFLRLFTNVKYLILNGNLHEYPPRYRQLLRKFPITVLKLAYQDFLRPGSIVNDFKLIWSLPSLRACQIWSWPDYLYAGETERINREVDIVEALVATREKLGICQNLSHLSLHYAVELERNSLRFPPKGAFGQSVQHLEIVYGSKGFDANFISRQRDLRSLQIGYLWHNSDVSELATIPPAILSAVTSRTGFTRFGLDLLVRRGTVPSADDLTFVRYFLFSQGLAVALRSFPKLPRFDLRLKCGSSPRGMSELFSLMLYNWMSDLEHSAVIPESWSAGNGLDPSNGLQANSRCIAKGRSTAPGCSPYPSGTEQEFTPVLHTQAQERLWYYPHYILEEKKKDCSRPYRPCSVQAEIFPPKVSQRKRRFARSSAWPPVKRPDVRQKDKCAIIWCKMHGGTKEDFQRFYTNLRSDTARKKWLQQHEQMVTDFSIAK